jgi:Uma2 family endonuclease
MFDVATSPEVSAYEIERNKPMPSLNHSLVQVSLIMCLAPYSHKYRFASELSLDLADWPSVPDLSILPKMKPDFRNDVTSVTEPPLGVIEIISPSQTLNQLVEKAEAYFAHGVKSCWLVLLPLTNIYVFSSADDYQIFRAHETLIDAILDIELPLNEVFS